MDASVIVVGAGPTGLMLAGELRLAGVDVIVLERLTEPTGQSRGLGFTARTLEVFHQRGLMERFGEVTTSSAGHFGGLPLDFSILDGIHFSANSVPQWVTERILAEWAVELGADIRRGHEVVKVADTNDAVEVLAQTADGDVTLRAAYLVGCDGGHSTVRRLAGFDFPGAEPTMEMFLADIVGADLPPRPIGVRTPGGMVMNAPIGSGIDRIIVCERGHTPGPRSAPPPFSEISAAWQRLTGEDISTATPLWTSSFTDAARQVTEYRRGRVFLAGDAAHVHLPAGGQGLNVGVQDAVNLGWKLGSVLRGTAPEHLLDTYHAERHPVGARVLMNTQAQGLLYLKGTEVEPLRELFAELMTYNEVNRHLAALGSGLDSRYEGGPEDHPLLGRRLPPRDLLVDGNPTTTHRLLHAARGVLLDLADSPDHQHTAQRWRDRVDVVTARLAPDSQGLEGARTLLIRPDGYIAWTDPGREALADALHRWFGDPA
ncbi:MAG: FAD-dependent monooxygenase [Thermobifida fusca]|nr:FAD-dependent monooxygenase [Thermobifida fusca]